ncbi:hypothetical protein [Streptomyces sp. NPDC050504]|uniref:hypothetical protein n=1 Tax=Streptomyces sp. NPDC050504 TaxID=3365618 RepID=UPI00379B992D
MIADTRSGAPRPVRTAKNRLRPAEPFAFAAALARDAPNRTEVLHEVHRQAGVRPHAAR